MSFKLSEGIVHTIKTPVEDFRPKVLLLFNLLGMRTAKGDF